MSSEELIKTFQNVKEYFDDAKQVQGSMLQIYYGLERLLSASECMIVALYVVNLNHNIPQTNKSVEEVQNDLSTMTQILLKILKNIHQIMEEVK